MLLTLADLSRAFLTFTYLVFSFGSRGFTDAITHVSISKYHERGETILFLVTAFIASYQYGNEKLTTRPLLTQHLVQKGLPWSTLGKISKKAMSHKITQPTFHTKPVNGSQMASIFHFLAELIAEGSSLLRSQLPSEPKALLLTGSGCNTLWTHRPNTKNLFFLKVLILTQVYDTIRRNGTKFLLIIELKLLAV